MPTICGRRPKQRPGSSSASELSSGGNPGVAKRVETGREARRVVVPRKVSGPRPDLDRGIWKKRRQMLGLILGTDGVVRPDQNVARHVDGPEGRLVEVEGGFESATPRAQPTDHGRIVFHRVGVPLPGLDPVDQRRRNPARRERAPMSELAQRHQRALAGGRESQHHARDERGAEHREEPWRRPAGHERRTAGQIDASHAVR